MPKTIISMGDAALDERVKVLKAFRIANKRAGEAKREGNAEKFLEYCRTMKTLSEKANALGFKLWVNVNGKTGHTYDKDYRETPDADNDFDAHVSALRAMYGGQHGPESPADEFDGDN